VGLRERLRVIRSDLVVRLEGSLMKLFVGVTDGEWFLRLGALRLTSQLLAPQ
jgi:hypothetical protein